MHIKWTNTRKIQWQRERSEEQICKGRTWMENYYMWPHLDTRGCKAIIPRHTTYTSREHPLRRQRHCQGCSCSAGDTMSCTCHAQPFYRLFPQASGRNREGLLTACAWHQQSCAHQPHGSKLREARQHFSKQSAKCCLIDLWSYLILHGSLPLQIS